MALASVAGYGKGSGRELVNSQLGNLFRQMLVRLGRQAIARRPAAERGSASLLAQHVGALVKEVELVGCVQRPHAPIAT